MGNLGVLSGWRLWWVSGGLAGQVKNGEEGTVCEGRV